MSWNTFSRSSLVLFVASSLALSGCAGGGWGRLLGKKDQPSAQLSLAWAKLKEEEGRLTDARAGYETVLSEQPNNVDAMLGMARLNVKAQRPEDAKQGYEQALKLNPKSPKVQSEVGQFYAQQQDWDKALPLLKNAQRIEPHEKSHQFTLGVVLTKAGRTAEALPYFTEAVGEAAAHYNVGRLLVESGKSSAAEEQFVLALTKDPNLTDAQYFLDEIHSGSKASPQAPQMAAQPKSASTTQQVSGTSAGRQAVTPAASRNASGREPLYPHGGYEELPAPSDNNTGASLSAPNRPVDTSAIIQTSGYSPATESTPKPIPKLKLLPPTTDNGARVRVSTTTQMPLGT